MERHGIMEVNIFSEEMAELDRSEMDMPNAEQVSAKSLLQ